MILFTIDTSGRHGRVGIVRRDDAGIQVLASESLSAGRYSEELISKFGAMLDQLGMKKADVDAFAVVAGPGSFTGLRAGLAAAKGLVEILQKPLTAISALELLAAGSKAGNAVVFVAMDAGRNDIFLGVCEVQATLDVRTRSEVLLKQAELAEKVREFDAQALLVTADARIADLATAAGVSVELIAAPDVRLLAGLAFSQLDRGITVRADDLDANYLRRSDAELLFAPQP